MEMADPFREGVPDFGDEGLNLLARSFARGVENARALASMDDIYSLLRAISSLDQVELQVTLFAMTAWYRQAAEPGFQLEVKPRG